MTQQSFFKRAPRDRGLVHRHIPNADFITRRNLPIFDGKICHRFYDTTATEAMREFLLREIEDERAANDVAYFGKLRIDRITEAEARQENVQGVLL